jgi:uncharacterized protein YuzE
MKVTYAPRHNVAYIRLRDAGAEVRTVRVSDELTIDLAPDGTVYGIELLNANEQLADRRRPFAVENTASGAHVEVAWPEDAA